MEFSVSVCGASKNYYYIYIGKYNRIVRDREIAELLDLGLEEYVDLLSEFEAINRTSFGGYVFIDKIRAQRFANYLNDKYLIMLKLCGKI